MSDKKWIQGAIKKEGSLSSAAERKGMTISEFCEQKNLSSIMKRKCTLAKTLEKFTKK